MRTDEDTDDLATPKFFVAMLPPGQTGWWLIDRVFLDDRNRQHIIRQAFSACLPYLPESLPTSPGPIQYQLIPASDLLEGEHTAFDVAWRQRAQHPHRDELDSLQFLFRQFLNAQADRSHALREAMEQEIQALSQSDLEALHDEHLREQDLGDHEVALLEVLHGLRRTWTARGRLYQLAQVTVGERVLRDSLKRLIVRKLAESKSNKPRTAVRITAAGVEAYKSIR